MGFQDAKSIKMGEQNSGLFFLLPDPERINQPVVAPKEGPRAKCQRQEEPSRRGREDSRLALQPDTWGRPTTPTAGPQPHNPTHTNGDGEAGETTGLERAKGTSNRPR